MHLERIRCTVRYDGTGFAGSQIQPGKRTVAGTLKTGLESILKADVHLLFAGRTDAGVHADGNVCCFDAGMPFPPAKLPRIINPRLPSDLEVRGAWAVNPDFHPRFSARARTYIYRIYFGQDVPVDRQRYCLGYAGKWDSGAVEDALVAFSGTHSFHCFAEGTRDPKHSHCTLDPIKLVQRGVEVELWLRGNRFLRQMVRRIAGAIIEVAAGRANPAQLREMLAGGPGFQFKPAPAAGLTLVSVEYDDEDEMR